MQAFKEGYMQKIVLSEKAYDNILRKWSEGGNNARLLEVHNCLE